MMNITDLLHLFRWDNLQNLWLTNILFIVPLETKLNQKSSFRLSSKLDALSPKLLSRRRKIHTWSPMRAAMWQVFPPGAAHISRIRSPGRGPSTCPTTTEGKFCKKKKKTQHVKVKVMLNKIPFLFNGCHHKRGNTCRNARLGRTPSKEGLLYRGSTIRTPKPLKHMVTITVKRYQELDKMLLISDFSDETLLNSQDKRNSVG